MKGAKINIRSSLTRKPSKLTNTIKSVSASEVESPKVEAEIVSQPPVVEALEDSSPLEVITGFKPKIVQHNRVKSKQNYSLRGIQADKDHAPNMNKFSSSRNVDLQWLDDCLAAEQIKEPPPVQQDYDDEDVLDPSDDERPQPPRKQLVSKASSSSSLPSPSSSALLHGIKRKPDEDEADVVSTSKKSRMDESSVGSTYKSNLGNEGTLPPIVDDPIHLHNEIPPTRTSTDCTAPAENAVVAAKKERLAKYVVIFCSYVRYLVG